MSNSVVWVVQEGNNDYSSAEEYGEVRFITDSDLRPIEGQQNALVRSDVQSFAKEYVPSVDYVVPSGNPLVCAMVAMSLRGDNHNFLKWDGRRSTYIPFTIKKQQ